MFAIVKPFIIACFIIFILCFALGMVRFEKPAYGCLHGRHLRFADKTAIVDFGGLKIYAYPLVADCPADDRYDPATVYACGYHEYCQKSPDQ